MTEQKRFSLKMGLCAALALLLALGCLTVGSLADEEEGVQDAQAAAAAAVYDADHYFNWKTQSYTVCELSQGSVTIRQSGIYMLTGTLADGSVTVDIDKDLDDGTVYLIFNNASVTSSETPVCIVQAKKVVVILESGTENTVTQTGVTATDEDFPSAAVFSKADLTITGSGSLTVTTDFNDGITGKDDLFITDGSITVNAAGDGIVGKDLLYVESGSLTVVSGNDGLKSNNDEDAEKGCVTIDGGSITVDAVGDAIQAETTLTVNGGTFALSSGGGFTGVQAQTDSFKDKAMPTAQTVQEAAAQDEVSGKTLKAGVQLIVTGGDFTIAAGSDALHSDGAMQIAGGMFSIEAADDAVHADTSLLIAGGTLDISACAEGLESQNITVDDGIISINSDDDGVNVNSAAGCLTINGGSITMVVRGDGMDSNGAIVQNGGSVVVTLNGSSDETAIDCDGGFTQNGGTVTDPAGNAYSAGMGMGMGMGGGRRGGW